MITKINLFLFYFLITSILVSAQPALTIFVSSENGSDSNSGTYEKPFRTISRAQQEVRGKMSHVNGDIHVVLREGIYTLDSTLVFKNLDGSQSGYKIKYKAFDNEKPVISGGREVKNWKSDEKGIWMTEYNDKYFRQLYVNGERRTRARHPDKGKYFRVASYDFKHNELILNRKDVFEWPRIENIEMILQVHWAESLLRLRTLGIFGHYNVRYVNVGIHPDDARIFFSRPNPNQREGQSYHLENSIAFLDQPGEWHYDRKVGKIYYYPFNVESIENTRFIVPSVQTLIRIEGQEDLPVRNIEFEGLTFMYSNWTRPGKKPYLNVQAGFHNCYADSTNLQKVLRPASAIHVNWAENISFKGNVFMNLGSVAIDLNQGTKGCCISGNVISNISGGGILVGKFVKDSLTSINLPYNPVNKKEICTNDTIVNNYITRTGLDYYGTCAIAAGYPDGLIIRHNTIREVPYTGISIGYGWTSEESAIRNVLVENNSISGFMNLLADGGGIYTLSKQPGTTIKGNYIFDVKRSPWASPWPIAGIYLDYKSGGSDECPMVLESNLVDVQEEIPYKAGFTGIVLHKNNWFSSNQSAEALRIIENAGLTDEYKYLESVLNSPLYENLK